MPQTTTAPARATLPKPRYEDLFREPVYADGPYDCGDGDGDDDE